MEELWRADRVAVRGSSLGQSLTLIRSRPHLSHTSVRATMAYDAFPSTDREKKFREYRKNNSKRAKGAPSPVDGQLQFRNIDEVIATVDRGGENARVRERASEIQAGSKQTRLKNNSPGGSRNPRESAVPLGGAGAHHQGPMHDGRVGTPGGPRGDGAATGKDIGCAYRSVAAQETYKELREVGFSGPKANAMLSAQDTPPVHAMQMALLARSRDADTSEWGDPSTWGNRPLFGLSLKDFNRWTKAQQKVVQAPATPQPVATATVHRAPAADASKALEEDGSDSDADYHIQEGVAEGEEGFVHRYDEVSETESITPTEQGEPELRSVPSGPPTSRGKLPSVELCDGCKTQLENLKRSNDPCDTLQSFKPCDTCLSAAIRVCRPCQADIHDDGSRDNGGHGKVNYDMLKNKTPKLQIQRHRHRMTGGALVCKQCYTQLYSCWSRGNSFVVQSPYAARFVPLFFFSTSKSAHSFKNLWTLKPVGVSTPWSRLVGSLSSCAHALIRSYRACEIFHLSRNFSIALSFSKIRSPARVFL